MSGSSIQLANGAFTNGLKASFTSPDRTGLLGEYVFGVDSTRSLKNIANNALPMLPTGAGAPQYTASGVVLSGSVSFGAGIAGYDTQITPTPDTTMIVVRKAASNGVDYASTPWFGTTGGFRGFINNGGLDYYNNTSGNPPTVPSVVMPTGTNFFFIAGTGANADVGKVYAKTKGVGSLSSLIGGSGGANGTFALGFSGGAGAGAAGTFTVSGGAVVSTNITATGDNYTSAPAVSFAASAGLTGASATAVLALNSVLTLSTGVGAGAVWSPGQASYKLMPAGNLQAEFAYAAIYNRVLSPADITAAYNSLKAYYASRGVTMD